VKLIKNIKKAMVSNEQAAQVAKTTAAVVKNRPAEGEFAETDLTAAHLHFLTGQLGGIIMEKDPNENNPLTVKDYLGFNKLSNDVNFIVEYKGHSIGVIGGKEVRGCSSKANKKWLAK